MNLATLVILMFSFDSAVSKNLLSNEDFEEPFDGWDNWRGLGCTLVRGRDAYSGQYCGTTTDRLRDSAGAEVTQILDVQPGGKYLFEIMIKLVNQVSSRLWYAVDVRLEYLFKDGVGDISLVATYPFLRKSQGWHRIGGDFRVPDTDIVTARIYVLIEDQEAEFAVDKASLVQLHNTPNWREEAELNIETIRKNNIELHVNLSKGYKPSDVEIEVVQTKSDFAFGCTANSDIIAKEDTVGEKYREIFFDFFEWAVIENGLKWHQMERIRHNIDFVKTDHAIDILRANGITVRGHALVWGADTKVQEWLRHMDGDGIRREVSRRIDYAVSHFRDRLDHWDVSNEQLLFPFYELKTGDADYIDQLFYQARSKDPRLKLFLNNRYAIDQGYATTAYEIQARDMKSRGVPVHGIGVQSHFCEQYTRFDATLIKDRVTRLGKVGLPIWVTELDYEDVDRSRRAQIYDDILTLFYSMVEIDGVLLWGFWNESHWKPNAALFEGPDFEINEAGERVFKLLQNKWKTRATFFPTSPTEKFHLRGFQGAYTVYVHYADDIILQQNFYLTPGRDQIIEINT